MTDDPALLSWLAELDDLLRAVAVAVDEALTPTAVLDPFRGLHVTENDVEQLLGRSPGGSLVDVVASPPRPARRYPQLERLERTFDLTPFDSAVLLLALAPEIDLRYERLYGYLQDDVTLRRPTVDLALTLLCATPATRLRGRHRLAEDAPLRRYGLIRLGTVRDRRASLSLALEPDPQVVRLLTGDTGLDPRLVDWTELGPGDGAADQEGHPAAGPLIRLLRRGHQVAVELCGPDATAHSALASVVAAGLRVPLLGATPTRAGLTDGALTAALALLVREAWLHGALLHVNAHGPAPDAVRTRLDTALAAFPDPPGCLLSLDRPAPGAALPRPGTLRLRLPLSAPDAGRRARIWAECLQHGASDDTQGTADTHGTGGVDVAALAARYRMTGEQIAATVAAARAEHAYRGDTGRLTTADLAAAARAEIRVDLGSLAIRVESGNCWDDLVVPEDVRAQLQEFCQRVSRRDEVLRDGGFADRLGRASGVPVLFAGPSGSGKTMAAAIIAGELDIDCYQISLASVVSKYIGETAQNLERIFAVAEDADLLLFFDECDALFGKRSEVRDAHDRYANMEIAYLLQRLESYPGPVILATNLQHDLDPAFTRRLAFTVHFPMPGPEERRSIWERIWPRDTRVADDVDAGELARRYAVSGGNIRNIAVASAFLAASDGGPVTRRHLLQAVRREYQKIGAEPPEVPGA